MATLTMVHHADNGDITKTLYAPGFGEYIDGKFVITNPGDVIPYSEIIKNEGLKSQILDNTHRFHGDPKVYYLVSDGVSGFSYFPIIGLPADFKAANGVDQDFATDYPLTYSDGVPWDSDGFMPDELAKRGQGTVYVEVGDGDNTDESDSDHEEQFIKAQIDSENFEPIKEIKKDPENTIRPNSLHKLASYSTQYDLYMMKPDDYNYLQDYLMYNMTDDGEKIETLVYNFIRKPERLLISSSGIQREPTDGLDEQLDLEGGGVENHITTTNHNRHFRRNYHINDINITSYVSPSKKTGGAKYTNATMKISEPYGATLIENLIKATVQFGGKNYIEMPYMLKISFRGWDENGNPHGKRFQTDNAKWLMLKIGDINFNVTPDGTEYNFEMYRYSDSAFGMVHGSLPDDVQVNSTTVGEFFGITEIGDGAGIVTTESKDVDSKAIGPGGAYGDTPSRVTTTNKHYKTFQDILNKQWDNIKDDEEKPAYPDTYSFKIDLGAGKEAVNRFKNAKILKADSLDANNMPVYSNLIKAAGIEKEGFSKNPNAAGSTALQLAGGMGIETCIKTVMSTSTFMTDQVTVKTGNSWNQKLNDGKGGYDDIKAGPMIPDIQTTYTLEESEENPLWLYKITPVVTIGKWDYVRELYQRNIQYVISLYESKGRAPESGPMYGVTDVVKQYDYLYTGQNKDVLEFDMNFSSAAFDPRIVGGYHFGLEQYVDKGGRTKKSQFNQTGYTHVDPFTTGYYLTRNRSDIWQAGSSADYRTVMAKNFMSKIYQGGADKLVGTLTIIGDPDFITQDEGFGLHAHSSLYVRNSVNTHRDPVILINFLTPPDINTETGLLETHSGDKFVEGNSISIFSGYYRVLIISSTISDNVFRQELSLVRVEVQEEQELKPSESTQEIDIKKKAPDPKVENANEQFHKNYKKNKIDRWRKRGNDFTVDDDNKKSSSWNPSGTSSTVSKDFVHKLPKKGTVINPNFNPSIYDPAFGEE